jgi:hypothetical protein
MEVKDKLAIIPCYCEFRIILNHIDNYAGVKLSISGNEFLAQVNALYFLFQRFQISSFIPFLKLFLNSFYLDILRDIGHI